MKKKSDNELYSTIVNDIAESVSDNTKSAESFLKEQGIDIEIHIAKGVDQIDKLLYKQKKNSQKSKSKKSELFFKRTVLAAEIASQLYREPTFGHVKFQKIVYLCEQISELKADKNYSKQAAGPYDNRFMHTIDRELKRQNWFDVSKKSKGGYSKFEYKPLENIDKYKDYYNRYFYYANDEIQWLINTFRKKRTNDVELIATLFYCWKEIVMSSYIFSDTLLIEKFYQWSKEKKKFDEFTVRNGIRWMRESDLIPIVH